MIEEHLKEQDFIDISFIDYELKWVFKEDFLKNAITIRRLYQLMERAQKQVYKWYVYANIHTNENQKNKIWDFLNSDMPLPILYAELRIKH